MCCRVTYNLASSIFPFFPLLRKEGRCNVLDQARRSRLSDPNEMAHVIVYIDAATKSFCFWDVVSSPVSGAGGDPDQA
jgi:hypothetical protein